MHLGVQFSPMMRRKKLLVINRLMLPIPSLFGVLFFELEKCIDYWVFTPVQKKTCCTSFGKRTQANMFYQILMVVGIHQNTNSTRLRKRNKTVDTTKQGTVTPQVVELSTHQPLNYQLIGVDNYQKNKHFSIFTFCKKWPKENDKSPTIKGISSSSLNRPVSIWSWCHAAASTACWHQYAAATVSFLFGTPSANTQCWQCHIGPSGSNCSRWSGKRCSAGGAWRLAFFLSRICFG